MHNISVINESKGIADSDVQKMLQAFGQQWNNDLLPVWGVDKASFTFVPNTKKPPAGSWWLVFFDNSDQAGALAYHDLTNEGLPISKVFVETILSANDSVSVGATHELVEMAVDPWLNSAYQDPQGTSWAGEIADPVPIRLQDRGRSRDRLRNPQLVRPSAFGQGDRPEGPFK